MNLRQIVPTVLATPVAAVLASVALLVASATLIPVAAQAAEPAATRSVSYADLNLASDAGQRVLQQRIRGAARSVCAPLDGARLAERLARRDCIDQAIAGAQASVPGATLAARRGAAPVESGSAH